jgi:hypothetical protein
MPTLTVSKKSVGFRLTRDALRLLVALSKRLGIGNETAVVEIAIREAAEKRGLK